MSNLFEEIKIMTGIEGFVLRFDDGHMLKIKTEEYVLHHKAKDDINFEKNILAIILGGSADDFRVLLSNHDRQRFENFEKDLWNHINLNVNSIWLDIIQYKTDGVTKKDFALQHQKKYPRCWCSIFFTFLPQVTFSLTDIKREYINIMTKNLSSQSHVDNVRSMFVVDWKNY